MKLFLVFIFISILTGCKENYTCVKGHYEIQSYYDVVLKMPMIQNVWVCDSAILNIEK